ncbi:FMN-binding protein [Actinomadura fulvescens]|uniref:FMN-binding domain-containing protein n=1 Tax=Actinomadura fulvescens TaxID=46160 RepID=A0ABN3Q4U1_9ACTN
MRRTTAAIAGTLSGAALLLAAKYGADARSAATGQTAGETGDLAPAGSSASSSPGPDAGGSAPPKNGNGSSGNGPARAANGLRDGVFRGNTVRNQYGPIQVTIRVAGGRITDLAAKHATTPAMTAQVNGRAIPLLRQAALSAQSARVDAVSGATFTSGSFAASLQSAVTAARA